MRGPVAFGLLDGQAAEMWDMGATPAAVRRLSEVCTYICKFREVRAIPPEQASRKTTGLHPPQKSLACIRHYELHYLAAER